MNPLTALHLSTLVDLARDARTSSSVVLHLTQAMRLAILGGRLPGGTTLPSTRVLAKETALGRSTWVEVIEQLAMEGYLQTRQGASTRVALIETRQRDRPVTSATETVRSDRWILDDPPTPVGIKAFRTGLPDLGSFPSEEWATLVGRRCRQPISHDLSYVHPCGVPALREALLVHLRQARGVEAEPQQVLIVPSAQAAFSILAQAAVSPGDAVWVEDPGYPGMHSVLRSRGAAVIPQPVDDAGICVRNDGSVQPKLIYTTPSHQYPTGVTMPLPRRLELLEYAARVDALVIEDDYDSEYQYHGRPIPSLQGLDTKGCVAYVGTFSKTLAPGLRMAYVVVPRRWLPLVDTIATVSGYAVPVHFQLAMADFISGGGFIRHLRRVTAEVGTRMQLLANALRRAQDPRLSIPTPQGGLQLCIGWHAATPDTTIALHLLGSGVMALALSSLFHGPSRQGLILGVGLVPGQDIEPACERLLSCLRQVT
jgi:GntR family transcriptional regulator/MocR family aminotransferase